MRGIARIACGLLAAVAGHVATGQTSDSDATFPGNNAPSTSNRHELTLVLDRVWADAGSPLGAWPAGGFGKLRFGPSGDFADSTRIAAEYRGRITSSLSASLVADYIDDAASNVGVTEAWLEWRPLPSGPSRHRYRFGAFYPAFSLENAETAWASPYAPSFSTINSWLGEEIRAIGAEWRLSRALGAPGSPHAIGAFAGAFYGNDPAGTLLFWRGWSAHDRQTRLSERLPLPPLVLPDPGGGPDLVITRRLDPMAEIDDRPGAYAGVEWRYGQRAALTLAGWDNRGDPTAFRDGQWAWGTRFWQLGAQVSLPFGLGLVAEYMQGDTDWLLFVTPDGLTTPQTRLVTDDFESGFVLLTRTFGTDHRLSLRRDAFDIRRPGELVVDHGHATALAWRYAMTAKFELSLEWLEIESTRDLWPLFYGQGTRTETERQLGLGIRFVLYDDRGSARR